MNKFIASTSGGTCENSVSIAEDLRQLGEYFGIDKATTWIDQADVTK